ncbi:unnamed protein product [Coregonus sp. 'balchen']|nr:unnamed protein product [Coregonus sp. 'balchen']
MTGINPGAMRHYNAVRLTLIPNKEAAEDGAANSRSRSSSRQTRNHDPPGIQQGSSPERLRTYPLSDTESKVVTVQLHNECIQDYDIQVWISRFTTLKSAARRVLDEDNVWTGARKWLVQLRPDPTGLGRVQHLPSIIKGLHPLLWHAQTVQELWPTGPSGRSLQSYHL